MCKREQEGNGEKLTRSNGLKRSSPIKKEKKIKIYTTRTSCQTYESQCALEVMYMLEFKRWVNSSESSSNHIDWCICVFARLWLYVSHYFFQCERVLWVHITPCVMCLCVCVYTSCKASAVLCCKFSNFSAAYVSRNEGDSPQFTQSPTQHTHVFVLYRFRARIHTQT